MELTFQRRDRRQVHKAGKSRKMCYGANEHGDGAAIGTMRRDPFSELLSVYTGRDRRFDKQT